MEISSSKQFNDNECCVCFVAYDDDQSGKDWVACACGRWLHEDCADVTVMEMSVFVLYVSIVCKLCHFFHPSQKLFTQFLQKCGNT